MNQPVKRSFTRGAVLMSATDLNDNAAKLKTISLNSRTKPINRSSVVMKASESSTQSTTIKALASAAVADNRMISLEEMEARQKIGIGIGAFTAVIWALYPPYRTMYGLLGVGVGSAVGLWRTGKQSL